MPSQANLRTSAKNPSVLEHFVSVPAGVSARNATNATRAAEKNKCDKLDSTPAKRACREREAYLLFGCPVARVPGADAPSRPLPMPFPTSGPLWVVRPSPTTLAGTPVTFELGASGAGLSIRRDYLLVSCEGPTIVLCDDFTRSTAASARLRVTCLIRDAGQYTVRAAHVFADNHGVGAASNTAPRPRLLHEITWPLAVHANGESAPAAAQSPSIVLPDTPCTRLGAAGRWVRRSLVCGDGGGVPTHGRAERRQQQQRPHALCDVPATESGWQWLPYSCYVQHADAIGGGRPLSALLSNRSLLFVGDSTNRFLWGALINLIEPNATRRFHQVGYGCMLSPAGSGSFLGGCDRFAISTARIRGVTLTSTQPATRVGMSSKGCTRKLEPAVELDELLARTRFDAAVLQFKSLGSMCEHSGKGSQRSERRFDEVMASVRKHQPRVPVLRRGAISWSPWSLQKGHCVSLQLCDGFEAQLSVAAARQPSTDPPARFANAPSPPLVDLPMMHITKPLYAVTHSAGVHAMPRVNTLLAHLLAAQVIYLLGGSFAPFGEVG